MTKAISTKVPRELEERILEAQEEGESKSAAMRRLIRRALDNSDESKSHVRSLSLLGSVLFVAGAVTDTDTLGVIGGGFILYLLVWSHYPIFKQTYDRYTE